MCSSMKQPKPDRLVEMDGIPMTVHSADGDRRNLINIWIYYTFSCAYTLSACMSHTWCVAPRLIVRGEDTEVAASYKLLIIHGKQRRGG